jgi:hypothetical protein
LGQADREGQEKAGKGRMGKVIKDIDAYLNQTLEDKAEKKVASRLAEEAASGDGE